MKNILETINLNKHYGKGESLVKDVIVSGDGSSTNPFKVVN